MSRKTNKREKQSEPKRTRYPGSAVAGAGAVLVLAVLGGLDFYQTASVYARNSRDLYRVGVQRNRLLPFVEQLPRDASVIGYVSDLTREDVRGAAAFSGAQYVLAPRVLVRADHPIKPKWVLGVFSRELDPAPFAASNRLEVVRTLGPGVVLFRREAQ